MTTQEIKLAEMTSAIAKVYVAIAKKYGEVKVLNTEEGDIKIIFDANTEMFMACDRFFNLTDSISENDMVIYIASIYTVEE